MDTQCLAKEETPPPPYTNIVPDTETNIITMDDDYLCSLSITRSCIVWIFLLVVIFAITSTTLFVFRNAFQN